MNEAFEKWLKTWPKKGQAPRPTVQEGFLAGLAAAEDKCAAVSQSFAGSRAAQRGCFACAWAIKAMRERE